MKFYCKHLLFNFKCDIWADETWKYSLSAYKTFQILVVILVILPDEGLQDQMSLLIINHMQVMTVYGSFLYCIKILVPKMHCYVTRSSSVADIDVMFSRVIVIRSWPLRTLNSCLVCDYHWASHSGRSCISVSCRAGSPQTFGTRFSSHTAFHCIQSRHQI